MSVSRVCSFCLKESLYVCPRCRANYCSLACYKNKSHEECTESFYRECCLESLRGSYVTDDNKKKMAEILRCQSDLPLENSEYDQVEGQDEAPDEVDDDVDDTDDNVNDLNERFLDFDFDDALTGSDTIWSRLTLKEKREFCRLLESNAFGNIIPTWKPWWYDTAVMNIQIMDDVKEEGHALSLSALPSLDSLLSSKTIPHFTVGLTLVDILLGYAFVLRLYNGDYQEELLEEAAALFCNIIRSFVQPTQQHGRKPDSRCGLQSKSENRTRILTHLPTTNHRQQFTNLSDVIGSIQYRLMEFNQPCNPALMILLLEDVCELMSRVEFCVRALKDCDNLLTKFYNILKCCNESSSSSCRLSSPLSLTKQMRSRVKFGTRKLMFVLACLNQTEVKSKSWQSAVLPKLRQQLSVELCSRITDMEITPSTNGRPSAGPNWRQMVRDIRPRVDTEKIIVPNDKKMVQSINYSA